MKRIGAMICLVALVVTMTATACFGATALKVDKTYPTDGMDNTTKDNMVVKVWFNNPVGEKATQKANNGMFKITDDKGKEIPTKVYYNPKDDKEVMVLADTQKKLDIKDNADYTLTISEEFVDDNGTALGAAETVTFKTMNQGQSTSVYMVMMAVMMGGMFFFMSRQMKKQREGDQDQAKKEEPFNPYKEAKKTGKSVEEVTAIHEKEMAKKAAKEAKKAAKYVDDDDDDEEEFDGKYKVKGPKPVAEGGSTFSTGRKALAEAKKAEAERLAKRREAAKKKKKK